MNWLAPLKTTGQLALTTLRFLARTLYILSTPLRWALYRVYASVVFLLSPLWIMIRLLLGAVAFVVNIVARFKVCMCVLFVMNNFYVFLLSVIKQVEYVCSVWFWLGMNLQSTIFDVLARWMDGYLLIFINPQVTYMTMSIQ